MCGDRDMLRQIDIQRYTPHNILLPYLWQSNKKANKKLYYFCKNIAMVIKSELFKLDLEIDRVDRSIFSRVGRQSRLKSSRSIESIERT